MRTPATRSPQSASSMPPTFCLKRTSMPSRWQARRMSERQVDESRWPQPCSYTAEKGPRFCSTSSPSALYLGSGSDEIRPPNISRSPSASSESACTLNLASRLTIASLVRPSYPSIHRAPVSVNLASAAGSCSRHASGDGGGGWKVSRLSAAWQLDQARRSMHTWKPHDDLGVGIAPAELVGDIEPHDSSADDDSIGGVLRDGGGGEALSRAPARDTGGRRGHGAPTGGSATGSARRVGARAGDAGAATLEHQIGERIGVDVHRLGGITADDGGASFGGGRRHRARLLLILLVLGPCLEATADRVGIARLSNVGDDCGGGNAGAPCRVEQFERLGAYRLARELVQHLGRRLGKLLARVVLN
eukprot:scaffold44705_cov24-Tisochrysis_lutea.AAC.4